MHFTTISLLAAGAISSVSAHGLMTSPTPRAVGDATSAACGSSVAAIIKGDPTSHVEGLPEAAASDPTFDASKCNLFLCKGLQFADNKANVMALTPGQSLELKFSIPIPHEGPCNVSVVDTRTNTIIGGPLISFASYADEALPVLPKNNTDMTVTVPSTLGSKCAVAGDCVIQWFWFGTAADQTYESCLDFTMADTSSGGGVDGSGSISEAPSSSGAGKTSAIVATIVSVTSGIDGERTVTLGTTPLPTASITVGSPIPKNSSTETETSTKSTAKTPSKTTSSSALTGATDTGTASGTGGTAAPSSSTGFGNDLNSKAFGLDLKIVAAWLLAADIALIVMA